LLRHVRPRWDRGGTVAFADGAAVGAGDATVAAAETAAGGPGGAVAAVDGAVEAGASAASPPRIAAVASATTAPARINAQMPTTVITTTLPALGGERRSTRGSALTSACDGAGGRVDSNQCSKSFGGMGGGGMVLRRMPLGSSSAAGRELSNASTARAFSSASGGVAGRTPEAETDLESGRDAVAGAALSWRGRVGASSCHLASG
jgi:hypothetical protein